MLLLHGGGRSMRKVLAPGTAAARWLEIADREGIVLIIPNGVNVRDRDPTGDRQTWNDPRGPADGRRSREDDVSFLTRLVDEIRQQHRFDAKRLYVTGASNGGMMSMRLLIEAPERFAAAAAFIAALPEAPVAEPPMATPIMMMNGTNDTLVRWQGGPVAVNAAPSRSVNETVQYFLAANQLDGVTPEITELPDANPHDDCRIRKSSWQAPDRSAAEVVFYAMIGGGHMIADPEPIELNKRLRQLLGNRCRDAHGIDLAWQFFSRHKRQ